MKTVEKFGRHGDVLLIKLDGIEVTGKLDETRKLALGEVTGHSHQVDETCEVIHFDPVIHGSILEHTRKVIAETIPSEARKFWSPEMVEIVRFLKPKKGGKLTHEEHKTLSIGDDSARVVVIQRDYRPEGYTKVID